MKFNTFDEVLEALKPYKGEFELSDGAGNPGPAIRHKNIHAKSGLQCCPLAYLSYKSGYQPNNCFPNLGLEIDSYVRLQIVRAADYMEHSIHLRCFIPNINMTLHNENRRKLEEVCL